MTSDQRVDVMSLLAGPTGHLVNLSTGAPGGEAVPSPAAPAHAAIEVTGRSTASTGTPLALSVKSVGAGDATIDRFEWTLPDGRTLSGEEVSVSFSVAGLHAVDVKAMSGSAVVAETSGAVAVFDVAAQEMPGFEWVPKKFGDVGQDGELGLDDLVMAAQGVAGTRDLDGEAFDAADVDISGALGEHDVRLLAQTLLTGAELPSAVLDEHGYPAGVVAMVSPALLDPDVDITVSVDGVQSPQLTRTIPGYASFVVPASLTGRDTEVDVVVEADGVIADRMKLLLKRSPDKPAVSAAEDVLAFLQELRQFVAQQEENGAGLFEETGGLSQDDTDIVLGAAKAAELQLETATAELEALLSGEGGEELATEIQASLYANGLAEFRANIEADTGTAEAATRTHRQTAESATRIDICANFVPAICKLKSARDVLKLGANLMMRICSVSKFALPQYRLFLQTVCVPAIVLLEVGSILSDLAHPIDMEVKLSSDKNSLRGPQTASIETEVRFVGLYKLCGRKLSDVSGALDGEILKRITKLLLRKSKELAFIGETLESLGVEAAESLLFSAVAKAVGFALNKAGLDGAFQSAFEAVCTHVGIDDTGEERHLASLPADGKHFDLQSSNNAPLERNNDGTYRLSCPVDFSGTVSVRGRKPLCVEWKRDVVAVTCAPLCRTTADGAVYIPDSKLRAVLREFLNKGEGDPITPADMERRCTIDALGREDCRTRHALPDMNGLGIHSLTGVECATGVYHLEATGNRITALPPLSGIKRLYRLDLRRNQISDVSSLGELRASRSTLRFISLPFNQISDLPPLNLNRHDSFIEFYHNRISDVSPFAALGSVRILNLHANRITDISPLVSLHRVFTLDLRWNQISDVSPLLDGNSGFLYGTRVKLEGNPLSTDSIRTVIPELERRGVHVTY